jgi:lysophospholipase L1-like esterase
VAALVTALVTVLVAAALTVGDDRAGDDPSATGASTSTTRRSTTTPSTSTTTSTTASPTTTTRAPPPSPPTTAAPAPPPAPAAAVGSALCIGDSVMLGASPQYLNTLSMCGTVDATESRQASAGPDVVGSHAPFPATVVIHLGTNGTVDGADLDAMLGQLRGVGEVVLVNVQHNGTRSWERQANSAIAAGAGRFGNVRLADWKGASNGHRDWFAADGIHLSAAGARAYADVIAGTLYAP